MKKIFILILVLAGCKESSKDNDSLSVFNNTYFSDVGYSFDFINKQLNSIYIFRSAYQYSGSSCIQLLDDGKLNYYLFDEEPIYSDNQRGITTYSSRKSNPSIEITKLDLKIKTPELLIKENQFLKENYPNVTMYENYTVFIPKNNRIFSIPCKYPQNNYSKEELKVMKWIKEIYTSISINENLFYDVFMDKKQTKIIDSLFKSEPNFHKFRKDKRYLIPSSEVKMFYHGSIFDSIGKYD